jgi:chromosome segregation ATPase
MSNLKQSFDQVRAALGSLDAAIADALNEQTQAHRNELIELTQSFEAKLRDQQIDYETQLAAAKEELEELRQNADEALDTQAELEAEKVGLIKTESPLKRILFEKLAERWEFLTNSEIEMLENVIDGKAVVL